MVGKWALLFLLPILLDPILWTSQAPQCVVPPHSDDSQDTQQENEQCTEEPHRIVTRSQTGAEVELAERLYSLKGETWLVCLFTPCHYFSV